MQDFCRIFAGFLQQSCILQDCSNNLAFYKVTKAVGTINSCRCVNLGIKGCWKLTGILTGLAANSHWLALARLLKDCSKIVAGLLVLNEVQYIFTCAMPELQDCYRIVSKCLKDCCKIVSTLSKISVPQFILQNTSASDATLIWP